jgi:predicted trehalose synthase
MTSDEARLATLESEMRHIHERLDRQDEQLADHGSKLGEIRDLLQRAKGMQQAAQWLWRVAIAIGGAAAAVLFDLAKLLGFRSPPHP